MKSLVVTNGTIRSTGYLQQLCMLYQDIICADGAVKYLREIDVQPGTVVGDMDSILPEDSLWIQEKGIPVIRYDTRKDFTDTEIAVRYALEKGAAAVTITGAFGGRMDHSLGNLYLLKLIQDEGCDGLIDEFETEVRLIRLRTDLVWNVGETVSFIPVSEVVTGLALEGFAYPLRNETIRMGSSRCLSNVVAENQQTVTLEQGLLAAVRNK